MRHDVLASGGTSERETKGSSEEPEPRPFALRLAAQTTAMTIARTSRNAPTAIKMTPSSVSLWQAMLEHKAVRETSRQTRQTTLPRSNSSSSLERRLRAMTRERSSSTYQRRRSSSHRAPSLSTPTDKALNYKEKQTTNTTTSHRIDSSVARAARRRRRRRRRRRDKRRVRPHQALFRVGNKRQRK